MHRGEQFYPNLTFELLDELLVHFEECLKLEISIVVFPEHAVILDYTRLTLGSKLARL